MMAPDAIVVGSGPAGLAAAYALRIGGAASILVVERDDAPGGLPRYCGHPGFGWEYSFRLENGPRFVRRMLERVNSNNIRIASRTTVLAIRQGPEVELVGAEFGHVRLATRTVVIATGTRERPRSARLVPGRRPEFGVLNTGQLQQIVARGIEPRATRAVVVGSEHVAFSVLMTARQAGISVVAILEQGARIRSFAPVGLLARVAGTDVLRATSLVEVRGSSHVEGVVVRCAEGLREIACDMVVFAGDFIPDSVLARDSGIAIDAATGGPSVDQFGRTNMPGVFAAGNVLRSVESSGWAAIEGERVGTAAAAFLRAATSWRSTIASLRPGTGAAYVVPQIWADGGGTSLPTSLRASHDFDRANVAIVRNGETEWSGRTRAIRAGRRLRIPANTLDRIAARGGAISIDII